MMFKSMAEAPKLAPLLQPDGSRAVFQDTFTSFYSHRVEILEEGPVLQQQVMQTLHNMNEFKQLRSATQGDEISSALGTIEFAPGLYNKLEELEQKLEERRKTGKKTGKNQGDEEGNVEGLLEEEGSGLRQTMRQALKDAQEKVDDWQECARGWGLKPGELSSVPPEERLALAEQLMKNPKLTQIANLMGRFKNIVNSSPATVFVHGSDEIVDVGMGSDISRMLPSEIVKLTENEDLFLRDYLEGKLLSYELKGVEDQGRGPIIACLDISGSMSGSREVWAKAVVLSLMHLASRQKRAFGFVAFEAEVKARRFWPSQSPATLKDRIEVASIACDGGGTDFYSPLKAAFEMRSKEALLKPADIVFITDGDCELRPKQLSEILSLKQQTEVRVFSIAINIGGYGEIGHTLKPFSDQIATCDSAGEIDLVKTVITKAASEVVGKKKEKAA